MDGLKRAKIETINKLGKIKISSTPIIKSSNKNIFMIWDPINETLIAPDRPPIILAIKPRYMLPMINPTATSIKNTMMAIPIEGISKDIDWPKGLFVDSVPARRLGIPNGKVEILLVKLILLINIDQASCAFFNNSDISAVL